MKNILSKIGGFFVAIYTKIFNSSEVIVQLPADLQITPAEIDEVIKAVNIVKSVVNSPATILVTDLTPITMDNEVRLAISDAMPGVLAGLTFAKGLITGIADASGKVNALLENIRLSDDPDKNALYHNLAARLIMIASKGKVSWSDAVGIIEIYFKQVFGLPVETPQAVAAAVIPQPVSNPGNGYQPSAPLTTPAPGIVPVPLTAAIVAAADVTPEQINKAIANLSPANDDLSIKL